MRTPTVGSAQAPGNMDAMTHGSFDRVMEHPK